MEDRRDDAHDQKVISSLRQDLRTLSGCVATLVDVVESYELGIIRLNRIMESEMLEIDSMIGIVQRQQLEFDSWRERWKTMQQQQEDELKDRIEVRKAAFVACEQKLEALGQEVKALLLSAEPFQLVIIRELLNKFRSKVEVECKQKQLFIPTHWNHIARGDTKAGESCRDTIPVSDEAFLISSYGRHCMQLEAEQVPHLLEEDVDRWDSAVYACHILVAPPTIKRGLCEIYEYVFGRSAELDEDLQSQAEDMHA